MAEGGSTECYTLSCANSCSFPKEEKQKAILFLNGTLSLPLKKVDSQYYNGDFFFFKELTGKVDCQLLFISYYLY